MNLERLNSIEVILQNTKLWKINKEILNNVFTNSQIKKEQITDDRLGKHRQQFKKYFEIGKFIPKLIAEDIK